MKNFLRISPSLNPKNITHLATIALTITISRSQTNSHKSFNPNTKKSHCISVLMRSNQVFSISIIVIKIKDIQRDNGYRVPLKKLRRRRDSSNRRSRKNTTLPMTQFLFKSSTPT
jgi:hypothetical protein